MIENHQNGAFDVLIAWPTDLKSVGFRRGIGPMPLDTNGCVFGNVYIRCTHLDEMVVRPVEILIEFDHQTSKEGGEFTLGFSLVVFIRIGLDGKNEP